MDESTQAAEQKRERKRKANREYMRRQRALGAEGTAYTAEQQRSWKTANPERVRANRQRFNESHPERVKELARQNRERNAATFTAYFEAYYLAHQDTIRARSRKWQIDNPERYKELKQRRRARERGNRSERVDALSLWTGMCGICSAAMDPTVPWPEPLSPSLDHIVPLCKGGTHTTQNLQWAHLVCNLRKGSKVP